MFAWKKIIIGAFCCVTLSGCMQSGAPIAQLPDLTFKHLQPIALDVRQIEIVDLSKTGMVGNHVEHLFPTSPKQAMNIWVRDRLSANGSTGLARLSINDASAIEERLVKKTGLSGIFTNDQSERYTTNIDVRLDIFDGENNSKGYALAKANRYITVPENLSLLEREKAWFEMVEKMMADLDKALVGNMNLKLLGK